MAGGYDGTSGVLASAELYDPATGTWTATGSLATARVRPHGHPAAQRPGPGGRGLWPPRYLTSAELYDPATGTWTATGSLATARYNHTATLLPNGQVLVAGGYGSGTTWPAPSSTTRPRGPGPPPAPCHHAAAIHTATLLPNGQVLVAGGTGSDLLTSAELYNPAAGTWAATGSMTTARATHTATLLPNGKVLVAGGGATNGAYIDTAELYGTIIPTAMLWLPIIITSQ